MVDPLAVPLERQDRPTWLPLAVGLLLVAAIGLTDHWVGADVPLGSFYIVAVGVAAWWGGAVVGGLVGLVAAAAWATVQLHGTLIWFHSRSVVYANAAMRVIFNVGVAYALSAWRDVGFRLERMVAARTAELQTLAADLSAAEDAQRRQLAHDIHDALGQNLSLLRIHLQSVARDLPANADGLPSRLSAEVERIDALIQQTRTLTFDLYPPMLDDLGLIPALEGYADEFSRRTDTEVTISQVGDVAGHTPPPKPVAHYLFRAARELMGNAVRHGGAKQIVVALHWEGGALRLTVDDDGAGFDPRAVAEPRRGLGMAAIRQRLTAMGGMMQVESQAGQGSRVILQLPVAARTN